MVSVFVRAPSPVYLGVIERVSTATGRMLYRVCDRWFDGDDIVLLTGPTLGHTNNG